MLYLTLFPTTDAQIVNIKRNVTVANCMFGGQTAGISLTHNFELKPWGRLIYQIEKYALR